MMGGHCEHSKLISAVGSMYSRHSNLIAAIISIYKVFFFFLRAMLEIYHRLLPGVILFFWFYVHSGSSSGRPKFNPVLRVH
jgi:hypothetical protein